MHTWLYKIFKKQDCTNLWKYRFLKFSEFASAPWVCQRPIHWMKQELGSTEIFVTDIETCVVLWHQSSWLVMWQVHVQRSLLIYRFLFLMQFFESWYMILLVIAIFPLFHSLSHIHELSHCLSLSLSSILFLILSYLCLCLSICLSGKFLALFCFSVHLSVCVSSYPLKLGLVSVYIYLFVYYISTLDGGWKVTT